MSGRETDEKDRLIGVFEMLVERLTSLEKKVDRVEAILERENVGREGRLNTRAWDLDMDVFVHKPLTDDCDFFSTPVMYYVKTCFDMDHLLNCDTYTIIQKKLVAGEFDTKLADCDSAVIKENARVMLGENDKSVEWITCEQVSLKSRRRFVYDHFLDVMISDWVASNVAQWKSITCMTEYGLSLWMEPSEGVKEDGDVRRCIDALADILDVIGVRPGPRRVQEAYYESDGPRKEQWRRKLAGIKSTYEILKDSIADHEFWADELVWGVFDRL